MITSSRLLGPQKAHAKVLLDSIYLNGFACDLSDTGCGKTYTACSVAAELNVPVVVICPKVVIPVWKKVLASFGIVQPLVINYEKICRGNTKWLKYVKKEYLGKKAWESKGMYLSFPHNSLIILDEVHKCKAYRSLQSDLLIAIKNHMASHSYKTLMLSATAATNPLEMKSFGYMANLHAGYNFTSFCKDKGADNNRFGGLVIDMNSDEAKRGMQRVHYLMFDLQMSASRMTVDQFDGIFPENHVIASPMDMGENTDKINRVYEQMESELAKLDERSANYSNHIFAIIMEARRRAEILKIPSLVEQIVDLYDEGISPVIFLNFSDSIESLCNRLTTKKLGDKIGHVIGGQKEAARQKDIEDFAADKKRIMLVNLLAGSDSINLHDLNGNHPRHSFIVPSFSAIRLVQALGRIARQGGLTRCIQKIVFSSGTIEERACEKVQSRLDNLATLNDNDLLSGIQMFSK